MRKLGGIIALMILAISCSKIQTARLHLVSNGNPVVITRSWIGYCKGDTVMLFEDYPMDEGLLLFVNYTGEMKDCTVQNSYGHTLYYKVAVVDEIFE